MQRQTSNAYNNNKASLYGVSYPYEDDTIESLIRREGFPPVGAGDQIPEVYECPCCMGLNPEKERDRLLRTANEEKERERRRLMQLDIFEERAKPLVSSASRPRIWQHRNHIVDEVDNTPFFPPPPATLDELRGAGKETDKTKLIVTIHYGKNINVDPRDPVSVLVRCGGFEGQSVKVPRGKGAMCNWETSFEFPYPNEEEPLEVLVVDDALPVEGEQIFGGIIVPPHALRNRKRVDDESLPVCPEGEMHRSYGRMKETPMGAIIVSWYLTHGDEDTENNKRRQLLDGPLDCVFTIHRIFQYADNDSEINTDGIVCVLRDTNDLCSDSALYLPGDGKTVSSSPYYNKEGYDYLPENSAQLMQIITTTNLGHVLICVSKGDDTEDGSDKELLVLGAVPLDFEKLYHKGSAVLLVESRAKEDSLWGELTIEWKLIPHGEVEKDYEEYLKAQGDGFKEAGAADGQRKTGLTESLFVTVMRGLNLRHRDNTPVNFSQVCVFAGDMEGSTFEALTVKEDENTNVVHWNQEVRFIEVDDMQTSINVHLLESKQTVSSGRFLIEDDQGVAVVDMHDPYDEESDLGQIVVSYNRVRSNVDGQLNEVDDDNEGGDSKGRRSEKSAPQNGSEYGYNGNHTNDEEYNRKSSEEEGKNNYNSLHNEEERDGDIKDKSNEYIERDSDEDEPSPCSKAPVEEQKYEERGMDEHKSANESSDKKYSSRDHDESRIHGDESDYEELDEPKTSTYNQEKAQNEAEDNDDYNTNAYEELDEPRHASQEESYPNEEEKRTFEGYEEDAGDKTRADDNAKNSESERYKTSGNEDDAMYPGEEDAAAERDLRSLENVEEQDRGDESSPASYPQEGKSNEESSPANYPQEGKSNEESSPANYPQEEKSRGEESSPASYPQEGKSNEESSPANYPQEEKSRGEESSPANYPQEEKSRGDKSSPARHLQEKKDRGGKSSPASYPKEGKSRGEESSPASNPKKGKSRGEESSPASNPKKGKSRGEESSPASNPKKGKSHGEESSPASYPQEGKSRGDESSPASCPQEGKSRGDKTSPASYPKEGKSRGEESSPASYPQEGKSRGDESSPASYPKKGKSRGEESSPASYPQEGKSRGDESSPASYPQEGKSRGDESSPASYPQEGKSRGDESSPASYPQEGKSRGDKNAPSPHFAEYPTEDVAPVVQQHPLDPEEDSEDEAGGENEYDSTKVSRNQDDASPKNQSGGEDREVTHVDDASQRDAPGAKRGASGQSREDPKAARKDSSSSGKPRAGERANRRSDDRIPPPPEGSRLARAPSIPDVKGPWYPSGSAANEDHVPLTKRESFRQRTNSIRELERRSQVSRSSGNRRMSQQSQGAD